MPPLLRILPWRSPPLQSAAALLLEEAPRDPLGALDLRGMLVVLPGARAARRLLELLVEGAEQRAQRLVPPLLKTPGQIASALFAMPAGALEPASGLEAQIAWLMALREADAATVEAACGWRTQAQQRSEEIEGPAGWALAAELEALRVELETAGLALAEVAKRTAGEPVQAAWLALERLEWSALKHLRAASRAWSERIVAQGIESGAPLGGIDRVVAVAVPEWSALATRALERAGVPIEVWVHAREEERGTFDAWGRPRTDAWEARAPEIEESAVIGADQPADQAGAVVGALCEIASGAALDEIAIGALDHALVPFLCAELEGHGIEARDAAGTPIERSAPHVFLSVLAEWQSSRSFSALARLARHPHAALALRSPESARAAGERDLTSELDRHWRAHLQVERDAGGWLASGEGSEPRVPLALERASGALDAVLDPLAGKARPLAAWADALRSVCGAIYGAAPAESHEMRSCLERLGEALGLLAALPPALSPAVSGAVALERWLACAEQLPPIPPPPRERGLDLLGALELHLDDAPVLVLAGLNEGRFPAARHADRLLPDGLRRRLGLPAARERGARDSYLLAAMLAPRRAVRAVFGRRSAEDEALLPSRLLLRALAAERAERIVRLLERSPYARPPGIGARAPSVDHGVLAVPRPRALDEQAKKRLEVLPVSAFRAYLQCPYRFYLRYALGLDVLDDQLRELDARSFGSLAHGVLEAFGESELSSSRDPERIRAWLADALHARSRERFGAHPPIAVAVQIEMLRRRLDAFAFWQAEWASQGWRILAVERGGHGEIRTSSGEVRFRGRIDRIDARGDELCVFDYKTGENALGAVEAHGKLDAEKRWQWTDLQLPLYHLLAREIAASEGLGGKIRLGYLRLPRRLSEVGENLADWDQEALDSAGEEAVRIAAMIRAERFWPPNPEVPIASDDFAALCQRRSLALPHEDEEEEADELAEERA